MSESSRKWWVLAAAGIACLLVAIDFTIVNTCLSNIQVAFNVSSENLQWVLAAFGISFCSLNIPGGRLADLLGARRMFYVGIFAFLITSLAAGFSQSFGMLVVARFLQGVGGAALFPAAMALVAHAFPKNQQSRALGAVGAFMGIGLAAGPVVGAVLTHIANWRWIFYVNVPTVFVCLLIAIPNVKKTPGQPSISIDWWGAFLLILSLSCLLFYINEAPVYGWGNMWMLVTLAAAIAVGAVFIVLETKLSDPLIPFHILNNKRIGTAAMHFFATISAAWAVLFIYSIYLSYVLMYEVGRVGGTLAIMTVFTAISPTIVGAAFHRYNKKLVLNITYVFILVGLALLMQLNASSSFIMLFVASMLFGIGWGSGNAIPVPLAVGNDHKNAGLLASSMITISNVMGLILLSVSTTILWHFQHNYFFTSLRKSSIHLNTVQRSDIHKLLSSPNQLKHTLDSFSNPAVREKVLGYYHSATVFGLHITYMFLLIFVAVCWLLTTWMLRGKKLKLDDSDTSGSQAEPIG